MNISEVTEPFEGRIEDSRQLELFDLETGSAREPVIKSRHTGAKSMENVNDGLNPHNAYHPERALSYALNALVESELMKVTGGRYDPEESWEVTGLLRSEIHRRINEIGEWHRQRAVKENRE